MPKQVGKRGRKPALTHSEIVTILLWITLTTKQKTLKDMYRHIKMYHPHDFPTLPHYSKFVEAAHRAVPSLVHILNQILDETASIRFVDSTMVPVCTLKRSGKYKVLKNIAKHGKNHQGWHFGFKLHVSMNQYGKLCSVVFTGANVYDAQVLPQLLNEHCDIAAGDTLYGASVMRKKIWNMYRTCIISPPFPKQKKKITTKWQQYLLSARSKIESMFDVLKEHLHLVSSFPRSLNGYLVHYLRILIGYQVG